MRSGQVQSIVGHLGGEGYEGGHTFGNAAGGGAERINMDSMLQGVNRGTGKSFYNLENELRKISTERPDTVMPVVIRKVFDGDSIVPTRFVVQYRIGDGEWLTDRFDNIRGG